MLRFIQHPSNKKGGLTNFNTSHVTVYPDDAGSGGGGGIAFQYIPCYGLSTTCATSTTGNFYFNTSHVTVYRSFLNNERMVDRNFNTSHVTVYL